MSRYTRNLYASTRYRLFMDNDDIQKVNELRKNVLEKLSAVRITLNNSKNTIKKFPESHPKIFNFLKILLRVAHAYRTIEVVNDLVIQNKSIVEIAKMYGALKTVLTVIGVEETIRLALIGMKKLYNFAKKKLTKKDSARVLYGYTRPQNRRFRTVRQFHKDGVVDKLKPIAKKIVDKLKEAQDKLKSITRTEEGRKILTLLDIGIHALTVFLVTNNVAEIIKGRQVINNVEMRLLLEKGVNYDDFKASEKAKAKEANRAIIVASGLMLHIARIALALKQELVGE